MPAWYTAIMMESEEVKWRAKTNESLSDSGPDDRRLIIEFEGDLEKMPWIKDLSCGNPVVDLNMLAASVPALFDKTWLRGRGPREAAVAVMGHHHIIDIQLEAGGGIDAGQG
ncbi:MAG: hypothetical protein ABFD82_05435 [Syntrophaceae bacterium]